MLELAEMIWRKIKGDDRPFAVVSDEPFEHDVQKRVPDVTKAREVLGFTARPPWTRCSTSSSRGCAKAMADGII